jgi:hypothetical protein
MPRQSGTRRYALAPGARSLRGKALVLLRLADRGVAAIGLRQLGRAGEEPAAVVEPPNDVAVVDAACGGILRIDQARLAPAIA